MRSKLTKQFFATIGRKGGQSKSVDKARASRENGKLGKEGGKLGGRPRGSKNKKM